MKGHVSIGTRKEILTALVERYGRATRCEKAQILDQFIGLTGYHRKHAIRLLVGRTLPARAPAVPVARRIYGEAVKEALVVIWEAADRICSKRLKVILPSFVESMEHNGHLRLDPVVRAKLFTASAATIDRLLSSIRKGSSGKRKRRRRPNVLLKRQVPVRTFSDWDGEPPGYCETDFVAHNGGITSGACIHTLVVTDVSSGWTDCLPLVTRQQSLVVEGLEVLRARLPFPLLGLDTDNDSAFMNETVLEFCRTNQIQITRSREYRKNDQAWIEQKNGLVVRRFVGYGRLVGLVATHTLGRLYQLTRLYVNFFQPCFKLKSKTREGAKVTKTYFPPATPCQRLLSSEGVPEAIKEGLREQSRSLDPVALLHSIRELQAILCSLAKAPGSEHGQIPSPQSLDSFLAALPRLWRDGDARPTHKTGRVSPRTWRTRTDPFEDVWPAVLGSLQDEPDITAKEIFAQLQHAHPGCFQPGQLRTLQRRVKAWRQAMARELIYAGVGAGG